MNLKSIHFRILNRLGYYNKGIKQHTKKLHGKQWKIPIVTGTGYSYLLGNSENWLYEMLLRIDRQNKIKSFIDVGVNIGQTLIKIKSVNKDISYIGFEPNSNCVNYVTYLSKLNHLANVNIIPCGLSNSFSFTKIFAFGETDTRGTLVEEKIPKKDLRHSEWIITGMLDKITDKLVLTNQSLLKVDVEGFELEVFKGAQETMRKYRPLLIFEVLPHHHNTKEIKKQSMLFEIIQNLNYNIYNINTQNLGLIAKKDGFHNADNFDQCEYFAIPIEAINTYDTIFKFS